MRERGATFVHRPDKRTGGSQRCLRGYSYSSSCLSCWRSSEALATAAARAEHERSSAWTAQRSPLRQALALQARIAGPRVVGDEDADDAEQVAVYCPECGAREFGAA